MARSSNPFASPSTWQCLRICRVLIWALQYALLRRKRSCWIRRARWTRSRMAADDSPEGSPPSSRCFSGGTSMWISIRSSSGPEIRARYRWICSGVHEHSLTGSVA